MTPLTALLHSLLPAAVVVVVFAPGVVAALLGLFTLATGRTPSERVTVGVVASGLWVSLGAALVAASGASGTHEVELGPWIKLGSYEVPIVFLVDNTALAFSVLAAALTSLVARFSRTYLHKEPGFLRFFVLLGLFSTGTQLIALAGALDLMFLGWELVGLSSTLFIGFFHERAEPVRSSLRAFVTYRVCDAGFLFAIVVAHELVGSTRLSALQSSSLTTLLTTTQATLLALLFLFAACGKSALLPFSGWLARAMEGPTPSSALFYGGVSIHAGLLLLLRVYPVLELSPVARVVGVVVGLATAVYALLVSRTASDAKGSLAHATLTQVGLILTEIALGLTTLAVFHLVGHALLRVWQYLRAPNRIHDAHRTQVHAHAHGAASSSALSSSALSSSALSSSALSSLWANVHARALFRLRLDERLDAVVDVIVAVARVVDRVVFFGGAEPRRGAAGPEVPILAGVTAVVGAVVVGAVAAGLLGGHGEPGALAGADAGTWRSAAFVVGALVAVVGGLASIVQRDLRGLYRSKVMVHAGFLGCALASGHAGAVLFAALTAAVAVAGFGFVVFAVERRAGRVSLDEAGGRARSFPHLAAAFAVVGAAGVGLPGSLGFVADDLLLHAAWQQGVVVTGALIAAAVLLAVGTLRAWQRVFLGPGRRSLAPDLRAAERVVIVVVIVVVVVLGVVPGILLAPLNH